MIGLERHLETWQAAGLIGRETAAAIRDHEAREGRPIAQWAIAGLALLALVLGVILVVAANWDSISGPVKLAVHFAATAAAAIAIGDGARRGRFRQTEGALFLLGGLVLAGIALQGQVYQHSAPMWQALSLWAALCVPAFLLFGATRLTGITLALMLGWLAVSLLDSGWSYGRGIDPGLVGAGLAMPYGVLLMARGMRAGGGFAVALRDIGLLSLLVVGNFAHVGWADTVGLHDVQQALRVLPGPLIAAVLFLAALHYRRDDRRVMATVVIATFAATAIVFFVPHDDAWPWRLAGALSFAAMWGAIGWTAHDRGWRLLFGVSIAAIATRLFIVYFELFGSLATTGVGLIVGGLIVLSLLLVWRRVMALAAPRRAGGP